MEGVQASLVDLPFDGSLLFEEKADSALDHFKDSRATARSLALSMAPRQPQSTFRPFCGHGRDFQPHFYTPSKPHYLFVAEDEVPTDHVGQSA